MGKSLADCIKQEGTIDKNLGSTKEEQLASIDQVITELKSQRDGYRDQVTSQKTKQISGTHAARFTDREATDPDNELNNFTPVGFKKLLGNIFQKYESLSDALNDTFLGRNILTVAEENLLHSLSNFSKKIGTGIDKVFKGFPESRDKFRHKDFIQYFQQKGELKLDQYVKDTIATVSYEWLATDARGALTNTIDDIRKILGDDSKAFVSEQAFKYLTDIGVNGEMLADTLGQAVAARLGIKPTSASRVDAQHRMEKSLGFMAIAGLQEMGILQRHDVFSGKVSDPKLTAGQRGIDAIVEGLEITPELFEVQGKVDDPKHAGHPRVKFYSVNTDKRNEHNVKKLPDNLEEIRHLYDITPDTIAGFYGIEPKTDNISFDKPTAKKGSRLPLHRTGHFATVEQSDNVIEANRKGYQESIETTGLFFDFDSAHQYAMLGSKAADTQHVTHQAGIEGKDSAIELDITQVKDFRKKAGDRRKGGLSSIFYIPYGFWRNMRIGMTGSINLQSSKLHRALFSMTDWEVTFNPREDTETADSFMEAVAFALDIESGKYDGSKGQIKALDKLLSKPVMEKALEQLDHYLETGEMTVEMQDDIVAAVKLGKNKVHSMKGLHELARFRRTQVLGGPFTTDLYKEIDGIGNGPTIGTIQLVSGRSNMNQVASTLMLSGFNFTEGDQNIDELLGEKGALDAYQQMGHEWADQVAGQKKTITDRIKKKNTPQAQRELATVNALTSLLDKFADVDGFVTKIVRGLSKGPTMQTIFGAGKKSLIRTLVDEGVIDTGINKRLIAIAELSYTNNEKAVEQLTQLFKDVHAISGSHFDAKVSDYITKNKQLIPEGVLHLKISPQQRANILKNVTEYHGDAMWNAVDVIYGSLMQTRKPFNKAVRSTVAMYNTLIRVKHNALLEEKGDPDYHLTVGDLEAIHKAVAKAFPEIKTPMGGELPMSRLPSEKTYDIASRVKQTYKKDKFPQQLGYTSEQLYLRDPGVAPIVNIIHMLDSMIANALIGTPGIGILNNHDGFSASLIESFRTGQISNEEFFYTMKDYYLGNEVVGMLDNTQKAFDEIMTDMGLDNSSLAVAFAEMKIITPKQLQRAGYKSKDETLEQFFDKNPFLASRWVTEEQNLLKDNAVNLAESIAEHKDAFMDLVTSMAQYSEQGRGWTVKQKADFKAKYEAAAEFLGIDPTKIKHFSFERVEKKAKSIQEKVSNSILGSAPNSNEVSSDINDYPDSRRVDSMNATEVFDEMVQMDTVNSHATIQASDSHKAHLKNLLGDIVTDVMKPVDLYLQQNNVPDNREAMGRFLEMDGDERNRIMVSTQRQSTTPLSGMLAQGLRMSTGETYAHELVHHITHTGLKQSTHLRDQVKFLYNTVRKSLDKQYNGQGYRALLNSDITPTQFETQAAKDRWNYLFGPGAYGSDGRSNYLDEFMALGLTNENFMRELEFLDVSDESVTFKNVLFGVFEKNVQTTIVNIFNKVMRVIHQTYHGQQHSTKAGAELKNLAVTLSQFDSKKKTAVFQFIDNRDQQLMELGGRVDTAIKEKVAKRPIAILAQNWEKLRESNTAAGQGLRDLLGWYNDKDYGIVASVITEMRGSTERLVPMHKLLHRRGLILDMEKEAQAATVSQMINDFFGDRELSDIEKVALTKTMIKTDLGALLTDGTITAVQGYISDEKLLDARIDELQRQIVRDAELQRYRNYFAKASDALGYFMVTGRGRANEHVMLNAHNIGSLNNTSYAGKLNQEQMDKATAIVDQLASLKALKYTPQADRETMRYLMQDNASAVEQVMLQHNILKEQAFVKSFGSNPAKVIKGYTKSILNPYIQYKQGTLADKKQFEDMGYTMQATPIARDPNDPVQADIYMFKSQLGSVNDLITGIASYTGNRAKGAGAFDIQSQLHTFDSRAVGERNNQKMIASTKKTLDSMFSSTPTNNTVTGSNNYMIPQFGEQGEITQLRYIMAESTKDGILEQKSEIDAVMGGLAGQIVDKEQSVIINRELIQGLKDLYDTEYTKYPEAYVEISAFSKEKRHRDIYHMMTAKSHNDVLDIWGEGRMYVSKDVIDMAFGGRKYTITEMFDKNPEDRSKLEKIITTGMGFALGFQGFSENDSKKGRTIIRAKQLENAMIAITKLAKNNIVVRNLSVTRGNLMSNLVYLKSKGLSLDEITRGQREAIVSSLRYQKDKSQLDLLKGKRDIEARKAGVDLTGMNREISQLENDIALNPSTKMIEAGLMPSIVDDVETGGVESGFTTGLEATLESGLEKLPNFAQNIGKTLFMSSDTEGYKMLNNAVKMTDYIGRFVLYKHYTKKTGMKHDDAIAAVNEEFINFSLPTHRTIEYLNNIGIVWFSKYQLRVLKQLKNVIADKPFTAVATMILASTVGLSNIGKSVPGVTKELLQAFADPFTQFTGSIRDILLIDIADEPFT